MQLPNSLDILELVKKDSEKIRKLFKPISKRIVERGKAGSYFECFLLEWGLIEQLLLPSLLRIIAHQLAFKRLPKFEGVKISQLIDYYFMLSHDHALYVSLKKANTIRNSLVHEILEGDMAVFDGKCKKATEFCFDEIESPILDRLSGTTPIPVLSLYANGWNACRAEMKKRRDKWEGVSPQGDTSR